MKSEAKTIQIRDLRNLKIEEFKSDIRHLELCLKPETDLDRLLEQYNTSLSNILEVHAPMQTKVVRKKTNPLKHGHRP